MSPKMRASRGPTAKQPPATTSEQIDRSTSLTHDEVKAIVRAELHRALLRLVHDDGVECYTSRKNGPRPAAYSAEKWREVIASIPGARRPGRWWVVSKRDFDTWVAGASPAPIATTTPANDSPKWSAHDALREAGVRLTRER